MIDAERMLGSLVRNAMGGRKRSRGRKRRRASSMLSGGAKGGLALGALGVAFGVFEHMTKQQEGSGGAAAGSAGASLPPVPGASPSESSLPPLPAGGSTPVPDSALPPLPSETAPQSSSSGQDDAMLLVRAMIAAANADHEVDDEERGRILESLDESGLGEEERRFVLAEIESPLDLSALAGQVRSPELAGQVYLSSLMAIEVDSRAEEKYLERLAEKLGLDAARVGELEALLADG